VGLTTSQLEEWFRIHCLADLATMPLLSLFADVMDFRLSLDTRWTSNDLLDSLFLCCATVHADAVGAERAATEYIRRSWRDRAETPPIAATLSELVDLAEKLVA